MVYSLLRAAAAQKQPVTAVYDGLPRLLCHTCWGRTSEVSCEHSAIRVEERGKAVLRTLPEGVGGWRCIAVDKLTQVELQVSAWRTEPRTGQQHCMEQVDFDVEAQSGCDPQNGQ